ncbi:GNAT family N-acetyltransferase [Pedobacter flavus]|uniref:GNAT family N-acetyltransferase n=1 Tax=Pedobacter flavus TaxID=3113906 RepID=A0ABU7GZW2_9SPHI|nr:GNAT family N-acetyltransferase [Pedobacter sp. VNH31]MEE1884357.1 GNAT family N-acetyltransferase [Pedobacter sp. VNH31]
MISFRIATEPDLEIVRQIAYETWPNTYNEVIGEAQVKFMLDKMYNKEELLSQLLAGCIFIIAQRDGKDVGFMSYELTNHSDGIYKLHKLYLLPEAHGGGFGKIMINVVFKQIKSLGGKKLQLNVNKKNKALFFYERMGFKIKEAVVLDIGNGFVMDDYVMEIDLQSA